MPELLQPPKIVFEILMDTVKLQNFRCKLLYCIYLHSLTDLPAVGITNVHLDGLYMIVNYKTKTPLSKLHFAQRDPPRC